MDSWLQRRSREVPLLAGLLAATLSSCGAASSTPTTGTPATYNNGHLSFTYPSNWRPQHYMDIGNFTILITYLSTDTLHDPCTRTTAAGGVMTTCGWPISQLSPGGVLVDWSQANGIGWQIDQQPGQAITIAGRQGKLDVQQPGACGQLGGDETLTATIAAGRVELLSNGRLPSLAEPGNV